MKEEEKKIIRRMVAGIAVLGVVVTAGRLFGFRVIPTHGFVLSEFAALLWVPFSGYRFSRSPAPERWWLYYGLLCFAIALPLFNDCIFLQPGRRPWMPDPDWHVTAIGLMMWFVLTPFCAAVIKSRHTREKA